MEPNDQVEDVTTQNDEAAVEQTAEVETAPVKEVETPEQKVARLSRQLSRAKKDAGIVETPKPSAGEAEDTVALLLEVKGLKEDDEVALFQKWQNETNRAPRTILNNSIFQAELQALRTEKATQAAIPSSNGRGGGGGTLNIDAAVDAFYRTGELPKGFEAKGKVLEIIRDKANRSTPPWRK